jgi:hypothetical protein
VARPNIKTELFQCDKNTQSEKVNTYMSTSKLKMGSAILILITSILTGFGGVVSTINSLKEDFIYTKDIAQEYVLAKAIWAREDPYRPILEMLRDYVRSDIADFKALPHPTPHPPSLTLFVLPIGLLDYTTFVYLWLIIECALLVAAIYSLLKWINIQNLRFWTLVFTFALVGWIPVALDLRFGQFSIPLLFLLSWFWLTLRAGKNMAAGALLGISIALKIMAWPLSLILLLRQNWQALGCCVVIVLISNLAAIGILGLQPVHNYFTNIARSVSSYYRGYAFNHSLHTLGWRLFHRTGSNILSGFSAKPLFLSREIASFVSLAAPLSLLVWAFWFVLQKIDLDLEFAFVLCVSILISPVVWIHYFVLLIIPISILIKHWLLAEIKLRDTLFFMLTMLLILFMYDHRIAALISLLGFQRTGDDVLVPFHVSVLTLLPMTTVLMLCLLIHRFRNFYGEGLLHPTGSDKLSRSEFKKEDQGIFTMDPGNED